MNDDIEIVRGGLPKWWNVGPDEMPRPPDPFAALDRIKTELENLEKHFVWEQDSTIPVCPNEAEVERLRALYNIGTFLAADDDNEETLLRKALAEVERLRRDKAQMGSDLNAADDELERRPQWSHLQALIEENERLREG